jgi:hypothetical protein
MPLQVLSNEQAMMLNKESPTFKNIRVGTGLQAAQTAINANETAIGSIKGAGYTDETLTGLAAGIAGRVSIGIAAGANAGVVDISAFDPEVTEIVAILAVVTASGAAAAKLLLEETTNYTFNEGVLTTVTDESLNTLIVFYK